MCAVDEADAHGLVLIKQWLNRAGKVSWLLSLDDWTLAAVQLSPASIIIQWRELITSPSRIALGICLHLTTIHQVVGCQPHPLNHAHSHGIQLSCQNVRGTQAGLRAPIRKIIAWHLLALNHNRILLLPFNLCSVHHRRYGIQKFLGRWNISLIVKDEIVEISAKEIIQRISPNLPSLSRKIW